MLNVMTYFIGTMFLDIFLMYCWNKLQNKDIDWKNNKLWAFIFLMTVGAVVFNFCFPKLIKLIISFVFLVIVAYFVVNKDLVKSMIVVSISQLVIVISELTFVVIGSIFLGSNLEEISISLFGGLLLNIYVAIVSFLIMKTKIPYYVYDGLYSLKHPNTKTKIYLYCFMMILIAMISTVESYIDLSLSVVFTTNTVLTFIFVFIMVKFAKSESNYNEVNVKYRTSLSSLQEYGDMVDKYRVSNHENQNQLLTIQNMTEDEKVVKYVESLLKEKKKNNNKILNKTIQIPNGEVRALIHAKLCKIDELKIKYKLDISKDVKTTSLIDLADFIKRDVCTILGVYIDNAIEAVSNLKKKKIIIEFYILDDYLCIDITNNFEGNLDVSKIMKPKYTTKGDGHGYGLALANKIISENKFLDNECEVIKNNITQRIKIKM